MGSTDMGRLWVVLASFLFKKKKDRKHKEVCIVR